MPCLTESEIAALVDGTVTPEDQDRLEQHLDECAACLDLVAAAAESEGPTRAEGPDRPRSPAPDAISVSGPSAGSADEESERAMAALDRDQPLEAGARIGRYLVIGPLGQGGMGVVYAAYDPELDRRVAIKLLRPRGSSSDGGQARLLREAQALARISHPNVVGVHDVGTIGDRVFLAMELVEGETARAWCRRQKRTWRELRDVFVAAGRGLAAAHGAGLIHRDFKPENVLVGRDGRVRVMDFGLARVGMAAPSTDGTPSDGTPASTPAPALTPTPAPATGGDELDLRGMNVPLTRAGRVMGTPQYMSPEQLIGRAVDARSDQFAFCAALYTCLFGTRAFRPTELARAATELFDADKPTAAASGSSQWQALQPIREPPRDAAAPPWLRRVVMRGLSLSPEARYPSMDALLQELSRDARSTRRRWVAVAAGVVVAALIGRGVMISPLSRCRGEPERRLAGVWDGQVKASAERAFAASGKGYVRDSWGKVDAALDAYSGRWAVEHRSVCLQLAGRGTDASMESNAARMVCLERRLQDLKAVTELLVAPRENALDRALDAVGSLRPAEHCQRAAGPPDRGPPGAGGEQERADVERISALLAQAKALHDSGQYKQGLEIARAAAGLSARASQRGLEAEALELGGWLQVRLGDGRAGETQLREAAARALASQRDDVLASAATRLVYAVGYQQGQPELAGQWVPIARAAAERIGGDRGLEVDLANYLGGLEQMRGNIEEAQRQFTAAERAAAAAFGPEHPKRAMALTSLAHAHAQLGQLDAAKGSLREALRITEAAYNPQHPSLAYPLMAMGDVLRRQRDFDGALAQFRRALEIRKAALGPDHRDVAEVLDWIGITQDAAGRPAVAVANLREALAIQRRALPAEHPDLVWPLKNLGIAYLHAGQSKDAVEVLGQALALHLENPALRGDVGYYLAQALRDVQGESRRWREVAVAAREDCTKAGTKGDQVARDQAAELDRLLAGK